MGRLEFLRSWGCTPSAAPLPPPLQGWGTNQGRLISITSGTVENSCSHFNTWDIMRVLEALCQERDEDPVCFLLLPRVGCATLPPKICGSCQLLPNLHCAQAELALVCDSVRPQGQATSGAAVVAGQEPARVCRSCPWCPRSLASWLYRPPNPNLSLL